MDFLDSLKRQLRSVIEWDNPAEDDLIYQWSSNGDEIKNASKLIVGPGQGCIFVYEGRIRGVMQRAGSYDLKTANIPFFTTLINLLQSFESEHKVGIYFFKTTRLLNQKWGTLSPIKYVDPEFGLPISLKAFGNFSLQIVEPEHFFSTVAGMRSIYTVDELRVVLASRLTQTLSSYLAGEKLSYLHIDSMLNEISSAALTLLAPDFAKLGFQITDFRIEGANFDDATIERIGQIADMLADNHAAGKLGITYAELQKLQAMRDAARNEGGGAGMVMGLGVGAGLSQAINPPMGVTAGVSESVESRLRRLKTLFDDNLITAEEFAEKKREIIREV